MKVLQLGFPEQVLCGHTRQACPAEYVPSIIQYIFRGKVAVC